MVPEILVYVCLGVLTLLIGILYRKVFIPCNSRSHIEEVYHDIGNS